MRKRGDGRWEGRIVVGHKEDGSPIFRSVFAKPQKELLGKLHDKIETYRDVELSEDSNITLGEWLDRWLSDYMAMTIRESTMSSYRGMVRNYIKPVLGEKRISDITTADVQKMYNCRRKRRTTA